MATLTTVGLSYLSMMIVIEPLQNMATLTTVGLNHPFCRSESSRCARQFPQHPWIAKAQQVLWYLGTVKNKARSKLTLLLKSYKRGMCWQASNAFGQIPWQNLPFTWCWDGFAGLHTGMRAHAHIHTHTRTHTNKHMSIQTQNASERDLNKF